ncbi:MAG: hypothetical protein K0S65_800, partial [Labilithrix sp.]|nr:hypothetical protein [Labilithrix sp.]
MNKALFSGLLVMAVGCGGGAVQQAPRAPEAGPAPPATGAVVTPPPHEPRTWALPEGPRDAAAAATPPSREVRTEAWAKAAKVKGVAAAPGSCATFAKPAPVKPAPTDLSVVLLEKDAPKRNALLFTVESSKKDIAPTLRAMRAELAPPGCGDSVTDPTLTSSPSVSGMAGQMTIGLSLASKLSRTAANAPAMNDASDKEKVKRFIQGPLRQWMVEQATAID